VIPEEKHLHIFIVKSNLKKLYNNLFRFNIIVIFMVCWFVNFSIGIIPNSKWFLFQSNLYSVFCFTPILWSRNVVKC
jgi:hypothetical protein